MVFQRGGMIRFHLKLIARLVFSWRNWVDRNRRSDILVVLTIRVAVLGT